MKIHTRAHQAIAVLRQRLAAHSRATAMNLLFPVVAGAVCWELLYGACGFALRRLAATPGVVLSDPGASKEKLARLGASYVVALVHALLVGLRGAYTCLLYTSPSPRDS